MRNIRERLGREKIQRNIRKQKGDIIKNIKMKLMKDEEITNAVRNI